MIDKPKQIQYKFSLSIRDKHNREVKKIVEFMRRKGILSQAVRDGLRLLNDLRRGNIKVLLEMFPEIVEKICPPSTSNGDLERQIADLKRIMLEQGGAGIKAPPHDYPQSKSLSAGVGSTLGKGKLMSLPTFDDVDDDDTVLISTAAISMSNSQNSMASMLEIAF